MNKPATNTTEIGTDTLAIFDERARARGISSAEFTAEGIRRCAERETDLDAFLKVGEDAIDRGGYLTRDGLITELRTWRQNRKRHGS